MIIVHLHFLDNAYKGHVAHDFQRTVTQPFEVVAVCMLKLFFYENKADEISSAHGEGGAEENISLKIKLMKSPLHGGGGFILKAPSSPLPVDPPVQYTKLGYKAISWFGIPNIHKKNNVK